MKRKSYSEMLQYDTFVARFNYLALRGQVGESTFGFDRYLNQRFYRSAEWKNTRDHIIVRDSACDLGILGREIYDKILVHHMNPLTADEVKHGSDVLIDPDQLICVTHNTHNAIHYGDASLLVTDPVERRPGDTTPWRS